MKNSAKFHMRFDFYGLISYSLSSTRRTVNTCWKAIYFIIIVRSVFDIYYSGSLLPTIETPELRRFLEQRKSRLVQHQNSLHQSLAQPPVPVALQPSSLGRETTHDDRTAITHVEGSCSSGDTFLRASDYLGGDLDPKHFRLNVASVHECCQQCEDMGLCSYWSWDGHDCWLKNAAIAARPNEKVISGRVSARKFLERKDLFLHEVPAKLNVQCKFDDQDRAFLDKKYLEQLQANNDTQIATQSAKASSANSADLQYARIQRYIVINEPRTGSSWLQELSQMHPGIKIQFELDMQLGEDAMLCKHCERNLIPDSKRPGRAPMKLHPPLACGMSIFGTTNRYSEVGDLGKRHNASLVILLRRNHVAHAISSYRHFNKNSAPPVPPKPTNGSTASIPFAYQLPVPVPWPPAELRRSAAQHQESYLRLVDFASETGLRSHLIFYEDLKSHSAEVWEQLQAFLGLPPFELRDIEMLERKSTSTPPLHYLIHLDEIRRELRGTAWYEMVAENATSYDERLDFVEEFSALCAARPNAAMSWRLHRCVDGKIVPLSKPKAGSGHHDSWWHFW